MSECESIINNSLDANSISNNRKLFQRYKRMEEMHCQLNNLMDRIRVLTKKLEFLKLNNPNGVHDVEIKERVIVINRLIDDKLRLHKELTSINLNSLRSSEDR